jgi:hypothetical protein
MGRLFYFIESEVEEMAHLLWLIIYRYSFMKKIIKLLNILLPIFLLITWITACNTSKYAVIPLTENDISKAITNSKWEFAINQVIPQYGRSLQATGDYTIDFNDNKLNVYLPYYGSAYGGANTFSGASPLDFTSNDFTTDKKQGTQGETLIRFKLNDNSEVDLINFTIFSNGKTSVNIEMINRTSISFNGMLRPSI